MDPTEACVLCPALILAASVQRPGGRHKGSWQVQPQCPLPLASWQPGQSVVSTGTVSLLSHGLQPGLEWVRRGGSRGLAPQQKKGTSACIICQIDALLWSGFHHNVQTHMFHHNIKCTYPLYTASRPALPVSHKTFSSSASFAEDQ